MTTNREWLYGLDVADLADWFDAEHVDANDVSTRKGDVRADDVCANDAKVDSREQLEAWAHEEIAEKWAQSDREVTMIMDDMLDMLDRQAAITEREAFMRGRASLDDEFAEYTDEIAELTAERDALADDLLTCNKEREEYRELFSEAITQAAEIVNLQP